MKTELVVTVLFCLIIKTTSITNNNFNTVESKAQILHTIRFNDDIYKVEPLPNSEIVTMYKNQSRIDFWHSKEGTLEKTQKVSSNVHLLKGLPNRDLAVVRVNESSITILDLFDGTLKARLSDPSSQSENFIESMFVLLNGDLACGYSNGLIQIWNIEKAAVTRTLRGHTRAVTSLTVFPNGDLVSGDRVGFINVWNTMDGSVKKKLVKHVQEIYLLQVLDNGNLVSASTSFLKRTIIVWNTSDWTIIKRRLDIRNDIVVLPSGKIAYASYNSDITIYDLNNDTIQILERDSFWSNYGFLTALPNGNLVYASKKILSVILI